MFGVRSSTGYRMRRFVKVRIIVSKLVLRELSDRLMCICIRPDPVRDFYCLYLASISLVSRYIQGMYSIINHQNDDGASKKQTSIDIKWYYLQTIFNTKTHSIQFFALDDTVTSMLSSDLLFYIFFSV